ncbi:polysaccharide deacetylase family protein [Clostridium sp.]|uniref:polysaccharide deacetylase family protein n=1 Tax=Clostridium sp. TaxID=1506 RepID=UPI0025827338|nr:polysaccharide deacetylase family protein [Clostridium sp.]MDF2503743.1 putative xylanase/chitin deacetylase [Clostridium sp.]
MRKNRLRRHNNKPNKFIMAVCIFVVCILFVSVGIIYTQKPKADSEANIKPKIHSAAITTDENKKQQANNSKNQNKNNDQATNKADNTERTNANSTDAKNTNESKENVAAKPSKQSSQAPSNNGENDTPAPAGNKVAYLTFDDGPSPTVTPQVLDVLKSQGVQATFFVIGASAEKNPDILRREKAEGHSIGNHTYSHDYNYIYSSTSNFINDLKKSDKVMTSIIGDYDRSLLRFPGGSFNRSSFKQIAINDGYRYFDWNCLTGDAEVSKASVDRLLVRFNQTFQNQDNLIILMHDAPYKTTTPQALPQIIQTLKSKGYQFKGL